MSNDSVVGQKFGRLTVVDNLGYFVKEGTKCRQHYVKCLCDCGNEKVVMLKNLTKGTTTSCGCYFKEIMAKRNIANRILNKYYVFGDIVFVKYSNCDEYFICDLDDWERLKRYTWSINDNGYAITMVYSKEISMHRLITNCPKGLVTDHIFQVSNGVCDNRKCNLRVVDATTNARNHRVSKRNTSGYTGVSFLKNNNKWTAYISVDCEHVYLGVFETIDDAIEARKKAELKYWGDKK